MTKSGEYAGKAARISSYIQANNEGGDLDEVEPDQLSCCASRIFQGA